MLSTDVRSYYAPIDQLMLLGLVGGLYQGSVLKLMFDALIRAAESWRGLCFTEFELRQLDVVRKDLDVEYEASFT